MTYEEEKNYLHQKALEFLSDKDYAYAEDGKNHLTLKYCGEDVDTEIESIELVDYVDEEENDCVEVCVRSHSQVYPDNTDLSSLTEFSNEEMKMILDLFGIKYQQPSTDERVAELMEQFNSEFPYGDSLELAMFIYAKAIEDAKNR
jgi:hypothetical protein